MTFIQIGHEMSSSSSSMIGETLVSAVLGPRGSDLDDWIDLEGAATKRAEATRVGVTRISSWCDCRSVAGARITVWAGGTSTSVSTNGMICAKSPHDPISSIEG